MFKKFFVILLQKFKIGSALTPKLVKLTGKHKEEIHPKHLIVLEEHDWYEGWIKKNHTVLDIGCGNGQRSIKIAKIAKRVTGFDINPKDIEMAKKEAKRLKVQNVEFQVRNANLKFGFAKNSFDIVFFCDVIEHLKNDIYALSEIHRVLKDNGILLLVAPNIDTSWKRLQKSVGLFYFSDQGHKREYKKEELEEKSARVGFKILKTSPVVYDTPLSGIIDLIGGFSLAFYKNLSLWKLNYAKNHPEESSGFRIIAKKV